MKEFLEIERQHEIMQKQELELAQTSKQNKEKVDIFFICLCSPSIYQILIFERFKKLNSEQFWIQPIFLFFFYILCCSC